MSDTLNKYLIPDVDPFTEALKRLAADRRADGYPGQAAFLDNAAVVVGKLRQMVADQGDEVAALKAKLADAEAQNLPDSGPIRDLVNEWAGRTPVRCGRYQASHPVTLRTVVDRLDGVDPWLGDWARQMVWWVAHHQMQVDTRAKLWQEATAQRDAATAEASRLRASLELAAGSLAAASEKLADAPMSAAAHLDEAWAAVKDHAPAGGYSSAASDLRAALRPAAAPGSEPPP